MVDDPILSPLAREQMAGMLPTLLAKVRRRRRRRHAQRAGAALLLAGLLALPWWWAGPPGLPDDPGAGSPATQPVTSICEIVRDRADVLDRYLVRTEVRPEWFIDDEQLQRLLGEDDRPAGLVRIAGRVSVVADALDPLPSLLE